MFRIDNLMRVFLKSCHMKKKKGVDSYTKKNRIRSTSNMIEQLLVLSLELWIMLLLLLLLFSLLLFHCKENWEIFIEEI